MAVLPIGLLRRVRGILLLALVYCVSGLFFLGMTSPGYVLPIFPPTGIALAALIIYGRWLWPGVLLGAVMLETVLVLRQGVPSGWWGLMGLAPVILLQTLAGYWLTRSLPGFQMRHMLRLLFLVAPLCCLIGVVPAMALMNWSGMIPLDEIWSTGLVWWLGDVLGILIASPLMFILFAQPRDYWREQRVSTGLPIVMAFVLLVVAFLYVLGQERERAESHFDAMSSQVATTFSRYLAQEEEFVLALGRLMYLQPELSARDWQTFLQPLAQRNLSGIGWFGWAPYVHHTQRAAFEARLQATGVTDFRIRDRNAGGDFSVAAPASGYLPFLYLTPFEGNEAFWGLNLQTLPRVRALLEKSADTGKLGVQRGVVLGRDIDTSKFMLYHVVRARNRSGPQWLGVISGSFDVREMLAAVLPEELEACLTQQDRSRKDAVIRLAGAPGCETDDWKMAHFVRSHRFTLANQEWELRTRIPSQLKLGYWGWDIWASIAVCTLTLVLFVIFMLNHTSKLWRRKADARRHLSRLRASNTRLQEQTEILSWTQRASRTGSWEIRDDGRFIVSGELCAMLGVAADRLDSWEKLCARALPQDRARLVGALEAVQNTEEGNVTLDCHVLPGEDAVPDNPDSDKALLFSFFIHLETDVNGARRVQGTVQDVSAQRQNEKYLRFLSYQDTLTHLPNGAFWHNRAQAALATLQKHGEYALAVMVINLDQFGRVNASLGRQVGDHLLTVVAQRLKNSLRGDDIVARLAGDEFLLLLPQLDRSEIAADVANRLLAALRRPMQFDGVDLSITACIGIALYPEDGRELDTLTHNANLAMRKAKEAGKERFLFFEPRMNARVFENRMLEGALRQGLERNEFVLHYQPQVTIASGHVAVCEALARWRQPESGLVLPAHFIPAAEDSGLILPLGEWVFAEACRQQTRWRARRLRVAINISARQICRDDFVRMLESVLAQTGADPHYLELEITESVLTQSGRILYDRLAYLHDMGFALALDDFGAGGSSLAVLKRLPFMRLKLDRSFVAGLPDNPDACAVAVATLALAAEPGLEVVAEGVETPAQLEFLQKHGCGFAQGFLFAKDMEVRQLENWLDFRGHDATPVASIAARMGGRAREQKDA
ncbi:MAG: EAL domain-containing protein [Zoogloeaceae bacterium]|jgi:diguanylate cyclase (GGDEF)-like protein|nr:EAL domain-containing protein [Zoogloeaceae bacterium]